MFEYGRHYVIILIEVEININKLIILLKLGYLIFMPKALIFPAHILLKEDNSSIVQTVEEHSRNTAQIAAEHLSKIKLDKAAYLAGIVHDMGKYTLEFKTYLENAVAGKPVRKGSVVHTHGATRLIIEKFHADKFTSFEDMTAEIAAYAAGAHHGLYDCIDQDHQSGFRARLNSDDKMDYHEAEEGFFAQCIGSEELKKLFKQANKQLTPVYNWIVQNGNMEQFFYLGLIARLILSAVIDGDREDTANFMTENRRPDTPAASRSLWEQLLLRIEEKLAQLPVNTPIQQARAQISQQCKESAEKPGGIYRLNVPTGGGKTLSSLRYALAHAAKYDKSRIIFTAPLLTILEQNAAVMRDYLNDDDIILEHHSNVIQESHDSEEYDLHELMMERWNAPVIITTMVQLLNTLFSGKTSCIRRFHALSDCVLVIDEVQTVPPRMLTLFNLTMNFLAEVCGATIVLCSATQPCFENVTHPITGKLEQLIPYNPELWSVFQRTNISYAGEMHLKEMPDFIAEKMRETDSMLVVCNTRKEAGFIYRQMKNSEIECFHLSAAMCIAHRKDTLSQVEQSIAANKRGGKKVLCVATQLIEAGVDISFGCVVRIVAGMDNAVQAAGRCNRNGELSGLAPVYLIYCENENLSKLPEIQMAKKASEQLLGAFNKNPEEFDCNLASEQAISRYYNNLYGGMKKGAQDYTLPDGSSLFDLLSVNEQYAREPELQFALKQAFKLAGEQFKVFEQDTTDIIVPYKDGATLIEKLSSAGKQMLPEILEKSKPFQISIYQFQKEQLEAQGGLIPLLDGAVLTLASAFYNLETGLTPEPGTTNYLEV